jgi:hypothetical protein
MLFELDGNTNDCSYNNVCNMSFEDNKEDVDTSNSIQEYLNYIFPGNDLKTVTESDEEKKYEMSFQDVLENFEKDVINFNKTKVDQDCVIYLTELNKIYESKISSEYEKRQALQLKFILLEKLIHLTNQRLEMFEHMED